MAFTGREIDQKGTPHNSLQDTLWSLALYKKAQPHFEQCMFRGQDKWANHKVGRGHPLYLVRAAFLPVPELFSAIMLNRTKENFLHNPRDLDGPDKNYLFNPKIIRYQKGEPNKTMLKET